MFKALMRSGVLMLAVMLSVQAAAQAESLEGPRRPRLSAGHRSGGL
jgi:hypothetical protein